MPVSAISHNHAPDRGVVLTKAVLRAAERLGLSGGRLGEVIGVSAPTVTRMKRGEHVLEEGTKPYELAALLVRVFRSLDAIVGGEEGVARAWMRSPNTAIGAPPREAIRSISGLTRVVAYLDARRAVV